MTFYLIPIFTTLWFDIAVITIHRIYNNNKNIQINLIVYFRDLVITMYSGKIVFHLLYDF